MPRGPLAPILAARTAPGPLPSGLLGSLRVLQSLQVKLFTDFIPTWSHIGGPGAHFEGPGAPFRRPELRFWQPLIVISTFHISKPSQACKPPSLQWPRRVSRSANNLLEITSASCQINIRYFQDIFSNFFY